MATKKYYWLKLKNDFFTNKKIKKLRRIAGGDTYTIIYLKMQLLSIKNEGKLYFENVEESFAEELALELDEDVENVRVTLMFLMKNDLLIEINEEEFVLPETIECIGSETAAAERVRQHRKKKLLQCNTEALQCNTEALQCNTDVTNCNTEIEKEIEKDKEKEIDIEIDETNSVAADNLFTFLESNFARTISPIEIEQVIHWQNDFNDEIIKYAITLCCNNNAKNINYLNAILNNWKSKGFTKIEECKNESLERKNKPKNTYKKPLREEPVPEWVDKDIKKNKATEQERKEMEDLLKEYQNP